MFQKNKKFLTLVCCKIGILWHNKGTKNKHMFVLKNKVRREKKNRRRAGIRSKMQEYVKVLLCMQKKLDHEAEELEKAGVFKAFHSYYSEKSCESIALEILHLQERAEAYRRVEEALKEIVSSLRPKERDAIGFRFHKKEIPKGMRIRTLYRNSVLGIAMVARELERRGFTKAWFFKHCGEDEHMMFLYRCYRSQIPIEQRGAVAACLLPKRVLSERKRVGSDSRDADSAFQKSVLQK